MQFKWYGVHVTEQNPSESRPKKLVLRRREPVPTQTTQGKLFARHIVAGDLGTFSDYVKDGNVASTDFEALGKLALLTLVCFNEGAEHVSPLTEETYSQLTDSDVALLVKAVAQACELGDSSTVDTVAALGSALSGYLSSISRQIAESSAAIKQCIDSTFGSLSQQLRATLSDRFSELSTVRGALVASSAVGAALQAQRRSNSVIGAALGNSSARLDSVRIPNLEAIRPLRFEDSAAGRTAARSASASEESARQLAEVAGLMAKMGEQMAALQTVFLSEVLPEWFRNLEDGARATNTTLRQAESSLFWAKWALVASVVLSVLMTGWQVWLAREYKLENDKQQESSELLMRQQLAAVRELNVQLTRKAADEAALAQGSAGALANNPKLPHPNKKSN